MDGMTPKECAIKTTSPKSGRPHPGALRPVLFYGNVDYFCERCAPEAERAEAKRAQATFDPANNPLSEDELEAAIQALGNLTGAQLREINRQSIMDAGASPAQRQIWRRVLEDHNARVLAQGQDLIKDLVVGARYRVQYWDPEKRPARGGGSLNLAANALTATAATVQNVARAFRGDVVTGELVAKRPQAVTIRTPRGALLGRTNETEIWTHTIASIEPA